MSRTYHHQRTRSSIVDSETRKAQLHSRYPGLARLAVREAAKDAIRRFSDAICPVYMPEDFERASEFAKQFVRAEVQRVPAREIEPYNGW